MKKKIENKKKEKARLYITMFAMLILVAFVVIGILSLAKVITNLYPLTILSFIFMACAYVLCIIDYSCGIIGKRRLLMQIIIYLLILLILILFLLML